MRSHVGRCSLSQRLNECRPNVSRLRFGLRAGDPGEKWAWAWSRDGRKCRPVVVRFAGTQYWLHRHIRLKEHLGCYLQEFRFSSFSRALVQSLSASLG